MKTALVVGSGAGGATCAKELQGTFQVTVLDEGPEFRPFSLSWKSIFSLKKAGLMFDERAISLLFPAMVVRRTTDRMILVNGRGTGGTTTISTGNALKMGQDLLAIGLDLDPEFEELAAEIPISTDHQAQWKPTTCAFYRAFDEAELEPKPTPKMGDYRHCRSCGRCVLGCPYGVKWDSRIFLSAAMEHGSRVLTGFEVEKVIIHGGRATGVVARQGLRKKFVPADVVILAAGGFGTPAILQNSAIDCEPRLFVDPVLTVATRWEGALQNEEVPMPFVAQRDGYILSPYLDLISFGFHREWKMAPADVFGIMIKLADTCEGTILQRRIHKKLTSEDVNKLREAIDLCAAVFARAGIDKGRLLLGTINAGHPGGMLPLTRREIRSLHSPRLPENVYVADASLLPRSLGNPPILTIIALAKRISKVISQEWAE